MFFNDRMVAVIITIADQGRINLYQLAKRSKTNRAYLGSLVRKMEDKGLLSLERIGKRKALFVQPTEKGKDVAEILRKSSKRIWDRMDVESSDKAGSNEELTAQIGSHYSISIKGNNDLYDFTLQNLEGSIRIQTKVEASQLRNLTRDLETITEPS